MQLSQGRAVGAPVGTRLAGHRRGAAGRLLGLGGRGQAGLIGRAAAVVPAGVVLGRAAAGEVAASIGVAGGPSARPSGRGWPATGAGRPGASWAWGVGARPG